MSSNLFLTKDLAEAFKLSDSKQNLSQMNTATHQGSVLDSVTSDVFISQMDATDMNELVNMLTSEQNTQQGGSIGEIFNNDSFLGVTSAVLPGTIIDSATSDKMFTEDSMSFNLTQTGGGNPTSATDTEKLETQLRKLLGGGKRRRSRKGSKKGSKKASRKSSRKGGRKSSRKGSKKSSKRRSRKSQKGGSTQVGGKRRRSRKASKKASKKASRKGSKKSSKRRSRRRSRKSQKGGSTQVGGKRRRSRKASKKASKKASRKSSRKGSKKSSKRRSRRRSRKSQKGGKRRRSSKASKKASKKASRKSSRKGSKKASRKGSKKASRKGSKKASRKSMKGGDDEACPPCPPCDKKKKKRKAPAHSALQTEVIKMIVKKDGINYPAAMKKLKEYTTKALGKPYEKDGDITYIDALKKTKAMLSK